MTPRNRKGPPEAGFSEPARACQSLPEPATEPACQSLAQSGRPWQARPWALAGLAEARQALQALQALAGSGNLWQALAGSGRGFAGKVPHQPPATDPASRPFQERYGLLNRSQSKAPFQSLSRLPRASRPPKPFEGFLGSRRFFAGGSISASCAEHPSIFSSTFSIFEACCVARPHASWPDPAPISIPHGTFSAIFEDHDDPCPAHATAVPTPHIANGGEKLISTATEPVFAYPIKVARNSPTKPSAFHYASWFGHSVFSGPVVSSGNFVCSEGFGRNMKI